MLTLGDALGKPVTLHLGAGEIKQTQPFGHNRKEGLARQEDMVKIMRLLVETDGLLSYEGNHWKYKDAWIGGAKKHPPRILALGGGPKLLELATKHCDGFSTVVKGAFSTPEDFEKMVKKTREDLERLGRDPDKFTFAVWYMSLVDDGSNDMDAVMENALIKWYSAFAGRLHSGSWRNEGLEPIFPDNFHYALHSLPAAMSAEEVEGIIARVPREMVKRSFVMGTPREVASTMRDYAQAGANYHLVADLAQTTRPIAHGPAQLAALIDTCREFKKMVA